MAIDKVHPAHALNRYLWSRIKAEGLLDEINYSGLVPIIPVEEIPEFMTILDAQAGIGTPTFIVYSWSRTTGGQQWFMKSHNVAYSIRSTNDDMMDKLLNLFEREFQDYDQAAHRVNAYIGAGTSTAHKRFSFTYINVQILGAPMPSESENGPSESLVTLSVNYTETTDDNTP